MSENWTATLSEEGSEEVLREQGTRAAETPQRLSMLERVRNAARLLERDDHGNQIGLSPKRFY